ncbi:hypothetical protein [Parasediminibacterium sp. JCM 36343]|uniref:hypothetical protein n=1 Tax=Parasediminibacterium sp. JCM 36343 TaxID=3374279 RepID=UPI00397DF531
MNEIEKKLRMKTIFISGSAESYGQWNKAEAESFIYLLSKKIVAANYKIVNGFGWGIGRTVINGALEAVYEKPTKYTKDQLILKPFPKLETEEKPIPILWDEYRQKMISLAGIAIFIFGNKQDKEGNIVAANGVMREFEIATQQGLIPIPIAASGYASNDIFNQIFANPEKYYAGVEWIMPFIKELATEKLMINELVQKIVLMIHKLNK